ncbi:MAG: hypothetical protein WBL20_16870 [Sphingobium sp.]|uniref:hypothetical protein n=1 Tax=Sphingobium sp. TaxID=1912891 RepID=UPI003BB0AE6B
MGRSIVDICNEALGEVPADLISDIDDESSMSARHCKRLLPGVVSDLLEAYDWDIANRRVALAQVGNGRGGQWSYAYALPTDLRSPIRLIPPQSPGSAGVVSFGTQGLIEQYLDGIEYEIADNVLYTHLEGATLEYSTDGVAPSRWSASFARLVVLTLASRLVMPTINDRARQRELLEMAELQRQRAIADEANRARDRSSDFVSERAMARGVGFML